MIKLYSTGCPKCQVLRKKLEAANIKFEIHDNIEEITTLCNNFGINSVPILEVNGEYLNFGEAVKWIIKEAN